MRQRAPRSVRGTEAEAEWDSLHEGVPPWLEQPLLTWLAALFRQGTDVYGQIVYNREVLVQLQMALRVQLNFNDPEGGAFGSLWRQAMANKTLLIDVLDWCAHFAPDLEGLERILTKGSSVWTVGYDGDGVPELQRRVLPSVAELVQSAASPGTAAERYLRAAWSHVYGHHRNPSAGYLDAVRAVEAVAVPVVTPRDTVGSLGKVIPAMRDAPTKWSTVFSPPIGVDAVQTAVAMMELLWRSQADRHGVPDPAPPIVTTQHEAEAALHLAATLVHWFNTGTISRVT